MPTESKRTKVRLQFEKVIIGNSLLALSAAYYEGVPVLVQGRPQYYFFDEYCYLQTRETRKSSDVWKEVSFQLTLAGLMPFGDLITSIREEEDFIEVITRDGKKHEVYCDKKEIVKRLPITKAGKEYREIIDWFSVKSGKVHGFETIQISTSPWRELVFYPTETYQGPNLYKDMFMKSRVLEGEENLEENSELILRFLAENTMLTHGIRGKKNGVTADGRQKYLKIKTEHDKRIVRPLYRPEDTRIQWNRNVAGGKSKHAGIAKTMETFGDPFGRTG